MNDSCGLLNERLDTEHSITRERFKRLEGPLKDSVWLVGPPPPPFWRRYRLGVQQPARSLLQNRHIHLRQELRAAVFREHAVGVGIADDHVALVHAVDAKSVVLRSQGGPAAREQGGDKQQPRSRRRGAGGPVGLERTTRWRAQPRGGAKPVTCARSWTKGTSRAPTIQKIRPLASHSSNCGASRELRNSSSCTACACGLDARTCPTVVPSRSRKASNSVA